MAMDTALEAHLKTGHTQVCHAWAITRSDGGVLGFTDHDLDLAFDGITFRADTGLSAMALQQSTGLSVDNTEAMGALSDSAIREADIEAGRYDGAEVRAWLVNWQDVEQRQLQFRGSIGEIRRAGGAFQAELRGLTDLLNRPLGRVYQKPCTAVLGDRACGFDLDTPGYRHQAVVQDVRDNRVIRIESTGGFDAGWFARGRLIVRGGAASGLSGTVKLDRSEGSLRVLELWHALTAEVVVGDPVELVAGCDKRFETCRLKFANHLNFQGFPDLPGDDWSTAYPSSTSDLSGGSRR